MLVIFLAVLFASLPSTRPDDNRKCRERNRPVSTEDGDLYTLIDATLQQKLVLECHYCNENDDARPRNWYKIDKLGVTRPHEVVPDMEDDMKLNRIQVNTEHSLIINNFSASDVGLYYCVGFEQRDKDEKYNYLVDLVEELNATEFETGNITAWLKYHDDYFSPINVLFRESKGKEFVYIRERLKLSFEVISQWDPWGICEVCGRPNNEGVRKKKGRCRVKITRNSDGNTTSKPEEMYFLRANAVLLEWQSVS